jgi:hypothetical protein
VNDRKPVEFRQEPQKTSTSVHIDTNLMADAADMATKIRRATGVKVTQSEMVEAGLRLWLREKGNPQYAATEERIGEQRGGKVEYPARLKPVIDELLAILSGPPEGRYHAMVQALLRDALREIPEDDGL